MNMFFLVDGIEGIVGMAPSYTEDEAYYYFAGNVTMPKSILTDPVIIEHEADPNLLYWKYMFVDGHLVLKPIILTPAEKEAQRELIREEIRALELPMLMTRGLRAFILLLLSRETNLNPATEEFKTQLDTLEAAIQVLRDKIAAIV